MRAAVYGLAEVNGDALAGATLVANPGCFATGLSLALWPLAGLLGEFEAHVTALTGASGSGARPSPTTHYPRRDGNVRAYKPLAHRHLAEVAEVLGAGAPARRSTSCRSPARGRAASGGRPTSRSPTPSASAT